MKRVLHCIESLAPSFGGPVSACENLTASLSSAGFVNDILTLDGIAQSGSIRNAKVHHAGPPIGFYRYCRGLSGWLRENLGDYDVVLLHGLWRHHSYGTQSACRAAKIPYYVFTHSMLNPWFNRGPIQRMRKALYWKVAERHTLIGSLGVILGSTEEQELAESAFGSLPGRKLICPLGIADPRTESTIGPDLFRAAFPELRDRRLWLFLGRLHPVKGCDLLLNAFAALASECRDVQLVIAGPDFSSIRPALEKLALSLGLRDRVVWTGALLGDDKWSALEAADLFVLPSHCESLSFSLVEALGLGCPAVITNKVNTHRTMGSNGGAIVVDDTVPGLIEGLRRWNSLSVDERERMRKEARRTFLDHFEIGLCTRRLVEMFRADLGWQE